MWPGWGARCRRPVRTVLGRDDASWETNMTLDSSTLRILNTLAGIAYIVSARGEIVAIGERQWAAFANDNQSGDLKPADLLGRNLFDFISGDEVRECYRALHATLINGGRQTSFEYRCDAPDVERRMLMSVSSFEPDNCPPLILYQSQIIDQCIRVPVPFLVAGNYNKPYDDKDLASICSFCSRVAWPIGPHRGERTWLAPEDYYAKGGSSQIVLSHGICPECFAKSAQSWRAQG